MCLRALFSLVFLGALLLLAVSDAFDWVGYAGGWLGWLIGSLVGIIGIKLAWESWVEHEHEVWMLKFWKELMEITIEGIRAGQVASAEPVVKVTFPASSDDVGGFYWDDSMALFHHADGASSAIDTSGVHLGDRLAVLSHVHTPAPDKVLTVTRDETQVSGPRNPGDGE
jgi:hypothetical protein